MTLFSISMTLTTGGIQCSFGTHFIAGLIDRRKRVSHWVCTWRAHLEKMESHDQCGSTRVWTNRRLSPLIAAQPVKPCEDVTTSNSWVG